MATYLTALRSSNKSFEGLVSQIKATYLLAKGQGNWRLQETLLLAIGSLGKYVVVILNFSVLPEHSKKSPSSHK